jgi:formylglycine-generating enzyme required for sulfatase activity
VSGFGTVAYDYRIGAYEVTNSQYVEFLNAKAISDPLTLYNTNMGSNPRGGIARGGNEGSYTYQAVELLGLTAVVFYSRLELFHRKDARYGPWQAEA